MGLRKNLRRVARRARFISQYRQFKSQLDSARGFRMDWNDRWVFLDDATAETGFDRHYVFHTAWAARELQKLRPKVHYDISSSLYFVAIASAFVPVRFFDYRPAQLGLSDLECERADLLHLPFADDSIDSLSCMHVVEHVGLARYGDPMDVDGDLKAFRELERVTAPGGSLLMVVPVGRPRIQFNAHRIYSAEQVQAALPRMRLADFALIGDNERDGLTVGLDQLPRVAQLTYGCGCFRFVKQGA